MSHCNKIDRDFKYITYHSKIHHFVKVIINTTAHPLFQHHITNRNIRYNNYMNEHSFKCTYFNILY